MSTSSRLAPAAQTDSLEVRPFPYAEAAPGAAETQGSAYPSFLPGDRLMLEEIARREQAARELGRQQGEAEARGALEVELLKIRQGMAEMLTAFARERENFYHKVEPEIVNLALNIARKILHREAQIDPLLLAGLVRVALEAIEFSTQVTVRVHPRWLVPWREYFTQHIDPGDMPELVEDPTLDENRCVLETHLGKTELGWEVQLKEIEQGLLDLLAQRPPSSL
jgi:flagellar assembly protein FliH